MLARAAAIGPAMSRDREYIVDGGASDHPGAPERLGSRSPVVVTTPNTSARTTSEMWILHRYGPESHAFSPSSVIGVRTSPDASPPIDPGKVIPLWTA